VAGSCESGNEPSCSTKFGEFLEKLKNYLLFRKDSVPGVSFIDDLEYSRLQCAVYLSVANSNIYHVPEQ
jgi:hypothetical protein